jgi:hypothetical protein
LVKDGATAIETLGDAIDASMNTALGTKKAGMVLLNTTSFSGVTSQSINSVFNATYDNYKIVLTKVFGASATAVRLRLRASGTDNTTASSYVRRGFGSDVPSGLFNQTESTTSWFSLSAASTSTSYSFQTIEIFNPFLATETQMTSTQLERNGETGSMQIAYHNQTVSYDGFTVFSPASTNISGTISVYGFNKA